MSKSTPAAVLVLGFVVAACGFPKAGPVPVTASPELSAGRATFVAKCNACHSHPDVNAISEEKWPGILDRMAKKADLSPKEREEVQRFILGTRTSAPPHS